jgi:hypothetical protein
VVRQTAGAGPAPTPTGGTIVNGTYHLTAVVKHGGGAREVQATQAMPAGDPEIAEVRDDTRQVGPGDLFVALPGQSSDGHRFLPEVAARVGYGSEAAFNRAFRRVVGLPPGAWRRSRVSAAA